MKTAGKEQEFPWVTARHACSPFEVYRKLQSGCERDVRERNDLQKARPEDTFSFRLVPDVDRFHVLREGGRQLPSSVEFRWTDAEISVRHGDLVIAATLTINNDGECRLKVGSEELTFWQFRKRALEDLFFRLKGE